MNGHDEARKLAAYPPRPPRDENPGREIRDGTLDQDTVERLRELWRTANGTGAVVVSDNGFDVAVEQFAQAILDGRPTGYEDGAAAQLETLVRAFRILAQQVKA